METIEIALASNANYFPGLLVTAVSLAQSASRNARLRFNILDGGIEKGDLSFLRQKLLEVHPHPEVRVYPVDEVRFAAFPKWNSGSRMTYARFLIAELLTDADYVVYCDVDFLWTADVAELWALRSREFVVQACVDDWAMTQMREGAWFAEREIDVDVSRYICAGMMVMNLVRFRSEGVTGLLMDFLECHPDVLFADQSAINGVIKDIGLLPRKWGRFARSTHERELPGAWAIHYAGTAPWKDGWWTQAITDSHRLWYQFYAKMYKITYREAIGRFLSYGHYWKRRLTWIVSTHAFLRIPFFWLLQVCNRSVYIPELKEMAKE